MRQIQNGTQQKRRGLKEVNSFIISQNSGINCFRQGRKNLVFLEGVCIFPHWPYGNVKM